MLKFSLRDSLERRCPEGGWLGFPVLEDNEEDNLGLDSLVLAVAHANSPTVDERLVGQHKCCRSLVDMDMDMESTVTSSIGFSVTTFAWLCKKTFQTSKPPSTFISIFNNLCNDKHFN